MDYREPIVQMGCVLEGEYFFALKKKPNVSTKYINFDPAFTHPKLVASLSSALVKKWHGQVDVLAGPAVGGIPLIFTGAHALFNNVRTVWADKQPDGSFAFERMGFAGAVRGRRVLVLEDVTSTGSSTFAVCDLVREAGGTVVGASVIWNRGNVTCEDVGAPHCDSLITESIETWEAPKHPMWGVWPLVVDLGHPGHFPDYPGPTTRLLD